MHVISSFPVIFTLPAALYFHSRMCVENLLTKSPTSEPLLGEPHLMPLSLVDCQMQRGLEHAESLCEIMGKMKLRDGDGVKLVDLSNFFADGTTTEHDVFQYDECVTKNDTKTDISRSDSWLDFVPEWRHEYKEVLAMLVFHAVVTVGSTFLLHYSLIGIIIQILARRTKQSFLSLPTVPSKIVSKIRKSILVPVSDQSESDDSEDEVFVECSSILLSKIDREESVPKADQREEKVTQNRFVSDEDCQTLNEHQISMPTSSVLTEVFPHDSNNQSFPGPFLSDSAFDDVSPLVTSTPRRDGNEVAPEKFRRYLHEKNQEMERLGISFDEDGYILEDVVELPQKSPSTTLRFPPQTLEMESIYNIDMSITSMRHAIWRKINYFF